MLLLTSFPHVVVILHRPLNSRTSLLLPLFLSVGPSRRTWTTMVGLFSSRPIGIISLSLMLLQLLLLPLLSAAVASAAMVGGSSASAIGIGRPVGIFSLSAS